MVAGYVAKDPRPCVRVTLWLVAEQYATLWETARSSHVDTLISEFLSLFIEFAITCTMSEQV